MMINERFHGTTAGKYSSQLAGQFQIESQSSLCAAGTRVRVFAGGKSVRVSSGERTYCMMVKMLIRRNQRDDPRTGTAFVGTWNQDFGLLTNKEINEEP
jgi:hypothetical protein